MKKQGISTQISNPYENNTYLQEYSGKYVAQEFTPSQEFDITSVNLKIQPSHNSLNLYVEIHDEVTETMITSGLVSFGTDLTKRVVDISLTPATLVAGNLHSIVIDSNADDAQSQYVNIFKSDSNPYADGAAWDFYWDAGATRLTSSDLYFVIMGDSGEADYDVNSDGMVDCADIYWASDCMGQPIAGDCIKCDVNNDGSISLADVSIIENNIYFSCSCGDGQCNSGEEGYCPEDCNYCDDTDGGQNYNVQGTTSGIDDIGDPFSHTDSCSGDVLTEYYCCAPTFCSNTYTCSGGCLNGACQSACTPNWQCSAWSTCSVACTQTRTCNDLNTCGIPCSGQPECITSQSCTGGSCSASCLTLQELITTGNDWISCT